MSYILEALKKAQAERQLGNAPTIHAPPPMYAAPDRAQGGQRRYLALGLGLGVVVALAALLWLRQDAEAPVRLAAAPVAAPVPTPVPAPAPVVVATPPAAPAPAPEPVQRAVEPVAPKPAPPPKVSAPPRPVAQAPAPAEPVRAAPAPVPASVPVTAAVPAPGEESLRSLQQLPEALRREIPPVAFGGYIYSPTPGESLLLVDKTLRREGEEVAPGLVLERLTPKAAVMNYRGTRYRVAY